MFDRLAGANSINQFTLEMPIHLRDANSTSTGHPTIAFLDTNTTIPLDGQVEVSVYRKATHTNNYLSFDSHSPAQSKRAVVKTLMDRAEYLPSSTEQRRNEKQRVIGDMKANGYPAKEKACEEKGDKQDQTSRVDTISIPIT